MKTWIWILSLCLWLPQAWAQKVQIFDAPGSAPGYEPAKTPAPVNIPPQPTEVTQESAAAPVAPDASVGADGEPVAKKPPEPTQQEKDLETIMEAVRKGTTIVQLIRDPILRPKLVSAYQKNPLTELPEPLVRASIIGQLSQNAIGAWLIQNVPALQDFLVEFVRDPVALGTLLRILKHTDDLLFYANISIILFMVMYFVRRQVLFTVESRVKRIFIRLSFTFLFWSGNYFAYSAKFGEFLSPTWEIFSKHFF
jgi:hypothetical protein